MSVILEFWIVQFFLLLEAVFCVTELFSIIAGFCPLNTAGILPACTSSPNSRRYSVSSSGEKSPCVEILKSKTTFSESKSYSWENNLVPV